MVATWRHRKCLRSPGHPTGGDRSTLDGDMAKAKREATQAVGADRLDHR